MEREPGHFAEERAKVGCFSEPSAANRGNIQLGESVNESHLLASKGRGFESIKQTVGHRRIERTDTIELGNENFYQIS